MIRRLLVAAVLFVAVPLASHAQGICPNNAVGYADPIVTVFPYRIGLTDFCKTKVLSSSGAATVQLPPPGTNGGFIPNFPVELLNLGTGTITVQPIQLNAASTPTINGTTSVSITTGNGGVLSVGADGNWYFIP